MNITDFIMLEPQRKSGVAPQLERGVPSEEEFEGFYWFVPARSERGVTSTGASYTNIQPLIAGERQLWVSQDFTPAQYAARASVHDYNKLIIIDEVMPEHNVAYKYQIFLKEAFPVHAKGEDDWVIATWADISISSFLSHYNDSVLKIGNIRKLPNNWDSYNAVRISHEAGIRAIQVLFETFQFISMTSQEQIIPFVAPCPDGGIQLEWEKNRKELEIMIPPSSDLKMNILRVLGDDFKEDTIEYNSDVAQYLRWLMED